jgi:hypothetical protein
MHHWCQNDALYWNDSVGCHHDDILMTEVSNLSGGHLFNQMTSAWERGVVLGLTPMPALLLDQTRISCGNNIIFSVNRSSSTSVHDPWLYSCWRKGLNALYDIRSQLENAAVYDIRFSWIAWYRMIYNSNQRTLNKYGIRFWLMITEPYDIWSVDEDIVSGGIGSMIV